MSYQRPLCDPKLPSVLANAVLQPVPSGLTPEELLWWARTTINPLATTDLERRLIDVATPLVALTDAVEDTFGDEEIDVEHVKAALAFYEEWGEMEIPAVWQVLLNAGLDTAAGLERELKTLRRMRSLYADASETLSRALSEELGELHLLLNDD